MKTASRWAGSFTSLALFLIVGCAETPASEGAGSVSASEFTPAPGELTMDEVLAATERFRDVNVALAEGFIPDPSGMCVTAEMEGRPAEEGAMGIHYIRPDLLGIAGPPDARVNGTSTHTDFASPAILLYEPQANGSLELVGVENLVFVEAWTNAGNAAPPTFHGATYKHMFDDPGTDSDEAHGFEPHYDLHIWLYRDNPLGIFTPMNPAVTCQHHGHVM